MNEFVQTWGQIILSTVAFAFAAAAFWVRQTAREENAGAIADLAEQVEAQERRLTKIEASIDEMPKRADLQKLIERVGDLSGDMKAQLAEMHGLKDALRGAQGAIDRVNDFLLSGSGR